MEHQTVNRPAGLKLAPLPSTTLSTHRPLSLLPTTGGMRPFDQDDDEPMVHLTIPEAHAMLRFLQAHARYTDRDRDGVTALKDVLKAQIYRRPVPA